MRFRCERTFPKTKTFFFPTRRLLRQKSQARTGHTREPDPTHNELKHTTTRKIATHDVTNAPQTNLTFTRAHKTSQTENDANQQTTPPRITATLPQPPPRASALASGTITCASSTDLSASASARRPKQARCLQERVRSRSSRRRGGRPRAAARTTRHLRACATAGLTAGGFGGGTRAGEA